MPELGDTCKECGHWTAQGREKNRQQALKHPIYNVDFTRPTYEIIEDIRRKMAEIRGMLGDIASAYPGWGERTRNVEGLLTCGIVTLADVAKEMKEVELNRR